LSLHVVPGAKKSEFVGMHGDRIKLRIAAPPVDGQANEEVIRFVAVSLGFKISQVKLIAGESSRQKSIRIDCQNSETVLSRVLELVSRSG
jgi:uncharacterized protein (TIGR00251 family)